MTFENIILGTVIIYLIFKIYGAIKNTSEPDNKIKILSSVNGQMVEVKVNRDKIPMQFVSALIEEDFASFAKIAFSRISQAFAKGTLKDIRQELSPKVFQAFDAAIKLREANKQHMDYTLIGFVDARVTEKTNDRISVEFITEQINLLKDEKQQVLEGDPMRVARVKENWTFERLENNWVLSGIKAGEGNLA